MKIFCLIIAFIVSVNLAFGQEKAMMMNPIAYAKIYFGDNPFSVNHVGSKTSFSSSRFIYGGLELDNQNLQKAFGISTEDADASWYLRCRVIKYIQDV